MTMRLAIFVLLLLCGVTYGQAQAPLPPASEIKGMVDEGKYRDALKALIWVLELKGDAAANYDRYEMLMLRGECQLQIRELGAAKDSYAAARKAAESKTDEKEKSVAMGKAAAMELLLNRSSAFAYKPKTSTNKDAPKEAISILDLTKRPRLMMILLADEMAGIQAKYDGALKSKSLVPIMDFAKTAAAIRSLELTVEGNNNKTTEMFAGLAKHAASLMDVEADAMKIRVEGVKKKAEELVTETISVVDAAGNAYPQTRIRRRGMTTADKDFVRTVDGTCKKFSPAAKELSAALGADATTFESATKKAAEVSGMCENLLITDYGVPVR